MKTIDPRERAWLQKAKQVAGSEDPLEHQLINLMYWIGLILRSVNPPITSKNPLDILDSGIAWCDQQVKVFLWCVGKLYGIRTREVALYHSDGASGHTVAEVFYGGKWMLFDVHSEHQTVYRHPATHHIMGYLEICQHVEQVIAEGHWWRGADGRGKEGFYMTPVLHAGISPDNGPGAAYCDYYPDNWT